MEPLCRIATVGRRSIAGTPDGATLIDVGGGTILPGFINAHVHDAFSASNLRAWARAGVTTVRDEGLIKDGALGEWLRRRAEWAKDRTAARLVSAGRMITAPKGYGTLHVASVEDARRTTEDEIGQGVDEVKCSLEDGYGGRADLPVLPADQLAAVVAAAHARGRRVSIHLTEVKFV